MLKIVIENNVYIWKCIDNSDNVNGNNIALLQGVWSTYNLTPPDAKTSGSFLAMDSICMNLECKDFPIWKFSLLASDTGSLSLQTQLIHVSRIEALGQRLKTLDIATSQSLQVKTSSSQTNWEKYKNTVGPRYPRSFYLRIRLFTYKILVLNAKFLVKICLFICEFSIRGPKYLPRITRPTFNIMSQPDDL
jgi:hypothetical protein